MMGAMAATKLLLASQNAGKLSEMRLLVEGLPYRVLVSRADSLPNAQLAA